MRVTMINADPVPSNLAWMEGAEAIEVFAGDLGQLHRLSKADAIIFVDLNAAHRVGRSLERLLRDSPAVKVLIDHHRKPEQWFDCTFVREGAAATGMLVYDLIRAWDDSCLHSAMATALYVAVVTDTGMFRYTTTTPAVHSAVACMMERGNVDPSRVHSEVFETRSPQWPHLLSRVMKTLTLRFGGKLAYIVITRRMLRECAADHQDTEGFVDFALAVDGVQVALVFTETSRGVKVSFRSKRGYPVDAWARALGGGGHRNAAGAYLHSSVDAAIGRLLESAPRHTGITFAPMEDLIAGEDVAYLTALTSS